MTPKKINESSISDLVSFYLGREPEGHSPLSTIKSKGKAIGCSVFAARALKGKNPKENRQSHFVGFPKNHTQFEPRNPRVGPDLEKRILRAGDADLKRLDNPTEFGCPPCRVPGQSSQWRIVQDQRALGALQSQERQGLNNQSQAKPPNMAYLIEILAAKRGPRRSQGVWTYGNSFSSHAQPYRFAKPGINSSSALASVGVRSKQKGVVHPFCVAAKGKPKDILEGPTKNPPNFIARPSSCQRR